MIWYYVVIFCINLKFYSCHSLWIKRSIHVEIILITYHKLRLLGTKGYNWVFPMFFLSTLGRARGNNMKYPNTLWGMAETSFGYPCKGYPKSSWNFMLLTPWHGALFKQVAQISFNLPTQNMCSITWLLDTLVV